MSDNDPTQSRPRPRPVARPRRAWRSRLLELLLWTLVAVGTAAIMIYFAETLLPANF